MKLLLKNEVKRGGKRGEAEHWPIICFIWWVLIKWWVPFINSQLHTQNPSVILFVCM